MIPFLYFDTLLARATEGKVRCRITFSPGRAWVLRGPPHQKWCFKLPPLEAGVKRPATWRGKGWTQGSVTRVTISPNLSPSARTLAVCGVAGDDDNAAPDCDGWFLSDFYLFHHILKGVRSNQIWLISENLKDLLDKILRIWKSLPIASVCPRWR